MNTIWKISGETHYIYIRCYDNVPSIDEIDTARQLVGRAWMMERICPHCNPEVEREIIGSRSKVFRKSTRIDKVR